MIRVLGFLLCVLACGCVSHSHLGEEEMHGVMGIRGEPVEWQRTTSYALHGLFIFDLIGDGSVPTTVSEFMDEAAGRGASRSRIINTRTVTYWFIFPPISFFIHPVITSVEGDLEGVTLDDEMMEGG